MPTLFRCRRRIGALILALFAATANAALDTNAGTDDHSINVPTSWWTYTNMTPAALADKLTTNKARLTDVEVTAVTNAGEPRFTARMVANSGAYAVPGWWWYYDQTSAQVTSLLNANTGRLIEVERYDRGGGQIRYAVVMVSNTGSAARGWTWLLGATAQQITSHANTNAMRPIDLDAYGDGDARRYNAVFVSNTGADARGFEWGTGQTPSGIAGRATSFKGRVVKLERLSDGKYAYVLVKATGADASAWWHRYGFTSLTDLNNYALQFAARPVDLVTYSVGGVRYYDASFIDNANAETRRMRGLFSAFVDANGAPRGIFESYLKRLDTGVVIDLNGSRRAEVASSIKVLHLLHTMRQVESGSAFMNSPFTYYNYYYYDTDYALKDRCPSSEWELPQYAESTTLEWGVDRMIDDSDNRTTRGVVLRNGGFGPLNDTAAWAKMNGTTLRHNVGCAYWDPVAEKINAAGLRNDTTASDLARVFEGVWKKTLLTSTNAAREEFLESSYTGKGAWQDLQTIINEEAAALGKSPTMAADFGSRVKHWGKGGSYDTCLSAVPGQACDPGKTVIIRSATGLLGLPIVNGELLTYRYLSYGTLISDVPLQDCACSDRTTYLNAWAKARLEIYRSEIRSALAAW